MSLATRKPRTDNVIQYATANKTPETKAAVEMHVETVTPETALQYLEYNQNWRKPTESRIESYARDMKYGNWELNGESIKFDDNGWLVDGQNRLNACVVAGVPFQTLVVRGVKASTQVDRGQLRNLNQLLSNMGHENATKLGAMLAHFWRYDKTGKLGYKNGKVKPTDNELLKILRDHPGLKTSAQLINYTQRVFTNSTLLATLHYLFGIKTDAGRAERFFDGLIKGSNLSEFDARWHLRSRLIADKAGKAKLMTAEVAALTIKAFNAYATETSVSSLRWRTAGDNPENFPEIIELKK